MFIVWLILAGGILGYRLLDVPSPDEIRYRTSIWVIVLGLFGATALVALGVKILVHRNVWIQYKAFSGVVSVVIATLLVAPSLLFNYVSVTSTGFVIHDFFWFDVRHDEARFADIKA